MLLPPFLLTATLLFWGWQTALLEFAIPMAFILESARWVTWRWDLTDKELNRFADISAILWLGAAFYLFNKQSVHGLFTLLSWLPLLFFPLVFAQTYNTQSGIKLSTLFISLRRAENKHAGITGERFNINYGYLLICILATSAIAHNQTFFIGLVILAAWMLWLQRPKRYPRILWFVFFISISLTAYASHIGLRQLQTVVDEWILNWIQARWQMRDPYKHRTALGDIGLLKQSDKIILRVNTEQPILLRETSYNTYYNGTWYAKKNVFNQLTHPTRQLNTWTVNKKIPDIVPQQSISINKYLYRGNGMLSIPNGSYKIGQLPAVEILRNTYGAIQVKQAPHLINYTVNYANTPLSEANFNTPPTEFDLIVPPNEKHHIEHIAKQLNLSQLPQHTVPYQVQQFFTQHFQYSLDLPTIPKNTTALNHFLHQHRQGHCEYFATATVLLLRQAGIPARYASGYAVEEYSELEKRYIARQRHSHAWALAYINNRWIIVDTTPGSWLTFEELLSQDRWGKSIKDIFSWLTFKFNEWRWQEKTETPYTWLLGAAILLIMTLVWRLYFKERVQQIRQQNKEKIKKQWQGEDSPFYQVINSLETDYPRLAGENLTHWLKRIPLATENQQMIFKLLNLHQRYRFDPQGITSQEYTILTKKVKHLNNLL